MPRPKSVKNIIATWTPAQRAEALELLKENPRLAKLREQQAKIQAEIEALEGGKTTGKRRGRKPGKVSGKKRGRPAEKKAKGKPGRPRKTVATSAKATVAKRGPGRPSKDKGAPQTAGTPKSLLSKST